MHECNRNEDIKEIKQDINKLYDKSEQLIRLTALMEQQMEQSKEQNKVIQKMSETVVKIGDVMAEQKETLKEMNIRLNKTNEKVEGLASKVDGQGNINFLDMVKSGVKWLIPIGLFYVLMNADKIIAIFVK